MAFRRQGDVRLAGREAAVAAEFGGVAVQNQAVFPRRGALGIDVAADVLDAIFSRHVPGF